MASQSPGMSRSFGLYGSNRKKRSSGLKTLREWERQLMNCRYPIPSQEWGIFAKFLAGRWEWVCMGASVLDTMVRSRMKSQCTFENQPVLELQLTEWSGVATWFGISTHVAIWNHNFQTLHVIWQSSLNYKIEWNKWPFHSLVMFSASSFKYIVIVNLFYYYASLFKKDIKYLSIQM